MRLWIAYLTPSWDPQSHRSKLSRRTIATAVMGILHLSNRDALDLNRTAFGKLLDGHK